MADPDLFEVSPHLEVRFERVADNFPVLLIDNIYRRPDDIRREALQLQFEPPPTPYPGRIAVVPGDNPSLEAFVRNALTLVNQHYLPKLPLQRPMAALTRAYTDFAVVDLHPDALEGRQRIPHVDEFPIFGLVYLNREDRGGTLFFKRKDFGPEEVATASPGYLTGNRDGFEMCGRIAPAFNRLVIYPGFVPHSAEISGDWIRSEERFTNPRLTQRLIFS